MLLLSGATLAVAAEPLRDSEVIARVNGEVIQSCELSWEVELTLQKRLETLPPEARAQVAGQIDAVRESLMQQLLTQRLDMVLFYSDFRSSVPQANLKEIHKTLQGAWLTKELPRLQKIVGTEDRAELSERLAALGTSLAERREDYFKKSIARAWLTESVQYNREVTHQQMLDYYHEHESDYAFPSAARWEELMVRFDRHPTKQEAWRAAATLGNRAYAVAAARPTNAPAFVELAKAESNGYNAADGGQHDWTTRGAMAIHEIDRQLFELSPGEMSPIIEGAVGFHIVRVLQRRDAGIEPFRAVQKEIRGKIRDDRANEAILERITKLKRNARIWTIYTGEVDTSRVAATKENTRR